MCCTTCLCVKTWDEIREFVHKEDRPYCLKVLIENLQEQGWDKVEEIRGKWPECELAIELAGGGN